MLSRQERQKWHLALVQLTVANSYQDKQLDDSQQCAHVGHGFGDKQQMQRQGCCSLISLQWGGMACIDVLLHHQKYTTPVD